MEIDPAPDEEEIDNLAHSNKKIKVHIRTQPKNREEVEQDEDSMEGWQKKNFMAVLLPSHGDTSMGDGDSETEEEFSDDDDVKQEEDGP